MIGSILLLLMAGTLADKAAIGDTVKKDLAALPGSKAVLFTEITDDGVKPLFAINDNKRFAVGSSFKLYILGTLADEANGDRRQFDNVMRLREDWLGPPSSELADWPIGSPVTLHTLVLKMISISDNTATDHLLHLLGREAIEKQMAAMGHAHPEWNTPLLSTREMTSLRDKKQNMPALEYQKLDVAARRKFLADRFGGQPDFDALDFDAAAYNLAEWYATPLDMAKAMAWLQKHSTDGQPGHDVRGLLSVEKKLEYDPAEWTYVGFKGGSEDQLLCGNWLLRNKNGRWYTFHVFCNSPREPVSPAVAVEVIGKAFNAVQGCIE